MMKTLVRQLVCLVFVICCVAHLSAQTSNTNSGFVGPNFQSRLGYMFDLQPNVDLSVSSFDIETTSLAWLPCDFEVWTTVDGGSHFGREQDPSSWRRIATIPLSVGGMNPFASQLGIWHEIQLPTDFFLIAGQSRGFFLNGSSGGIVGSNSLIAGAIQSSNSDLSVFAGISNRDFSSFGSNPCSLGVNYTLHGPNGIDIRVDRVLSPNFDPLLCSNGSTTEEISAEFVNLGTNTLVSGTVIPVGYSINGGPPIIEMITLTSSILPRGRFTYAFLTTADLSALGRHEIEVFHSFPSDQESANDSAVVVCNSGGDLRITVFPWAESFDHLSNANRVIPPNGWNHEFGTPLSGASEWTFHSVKRSQSGPAVDHTTGISGSGFFASTRDNVNLPGLSLRSPCCDFSSLGSPHLTFWVHSHALNPIYQNQLHIDVIQVQSGVLVLDVVPPIGDLGPGWQLEEVDLSAFAGELVRVIFRASTNYGSVSSTTLNNHDIAIDDVVFFDDDALVGQPDQPGLASLDFVGAVNNRYEVVGGGNPGPYQLTVTPGESLQIKIGGQANQPGIMLAGPLNPMAASFANLGFLDLGGPPDLITGIPVGISVIADGSLNSGINIFMNTTASGTGVIGFSVPNLPPGILGSFQCVMHTSGSNGAPIALSNAATLTIN